MISVQRMRLVAQHPRPVRCMNVMTESGKPWRYVGIACGVTTPRLPVASCRVLALRAWHEPAGHRGRPRPAGSLRAARRCRGRAPRGSAGRARHNARRCRACPIPRRRSRASETLPCAASSTMTHAQAHASILVPRGDRSRTHRARPVHRRRAGAVSRRDLPRDQADLTARRSRSPGARDLIVELGRMSRRSKDVLDRRELHAVRLGDRLVDDRRHGIAPHRSERSRLTASARPWSASPPRRTASFVSALVEVIRTYLPGMFATQ